MMSDLQRVVALTGVILAINLKKVNMTIDYWTCAGSDGESSKSSKKATKNHTTFDKLPTPIIFGSLLWTT